MLEAGTDTSYPMLTVLGGLAEFERDLIRGRTSESRERAKPEMSNSIAKPKLTEPQKCETIRRRCAWQASENP